MPRMWMAVIATLAIAYASGASAQPITGNARTLLAVVVNAQGRPLVDLGLDDFVVSEGGSARDVLDVHIADYPLAILLDDRPAQGSSLSGIRDAARRFIERVGERPVALVRLSDGAHAVTTLDDDRATVLQRLQVLTPGNTRVTDPLDTIARAAGILKDSGAPFSAVIVVAAGLVDAAALVRGELLPQIQDSGATVHVVEYQPPDGTQPSDASEPDLLRVIAEQTRGQFTPIFTAASYEAALARLADRLAVEMMVQYMVPAGPKAGDVQVGVRVPGARVIGMGVK